MENHEGIISLDFRQCRSSPALVVGRYATIEEGEVRNALEMVRSVSDKHLDLLRPSSRYYSIFKGQATDAVDREKGKYTLIRDEDDSQLGLYDKPLPCFGCGIGWFSFLVPFDVVLCYNLVLGNYYRKDPRNELDLLLLQLL
ncbi:hypothetical protein DH2020_014618 [Rehmannia glutinosa]|uniref:Uncharacterized protein n=1 Tax=Rehmannia glutinosa TaxID=99300 RepID=A0ABR0WYF7_REHGL